MDNSSTITSRFRNKFWFVFFALFVFWYLILYGFDWSSISGLTSSLPSSVNHALQEKPNIQSVIPAQEEQLSNYNIDPEEQERVANATIFSIEETSANFSGDNETEKEEVIEDDEEQDVMQEIGDLEKEFEPDDESEGEKSTCNGRYIYVHELPSRFNQDLLKQCRLLNKWADMCQYLSNNGLGTDFGNSGRVFSKTCWFNTNQFSLEVIFHNRMKQYGCLTNNSSKAAAVFVPYYAGLDVSRYLWGSNSTIRDADSLDLAEWLRGKPEWKRMSGRDHFMVAGRITWDFRRGVDEDYAWGNKLMLLPEMKNMTILTIESSPWNRNDFAIPYPTYFHPWNDNDVVNWQNRMKKQRRKTLFCFAGGPRPDMPDSIRAQIIDQCKSAKRKCALMECPTNSKNKCQKPEQIMKMFQNSIFCLQPPGDSFTRRSTFDAILAGCIPVFFTPASAYVQYLWHLPKDYKKYSVLIPEEDVKNKAVSIENVLSRIPKSRVYAMREAVIRMIPHVVYADPRSRMKKHQDAFDLTTKGVIERVQSLRKEKDPRYSFEEEASWKYYTFGMVGKHEWDHYFLRTDKANY